MTLLGTAACRECGSWGQEMIEINEELISAEMVKSIEAMKIQGYSHEVSVVVTLKSGGLYHLLDVSCECVRCGASY